MVLSQFMQMVNEQLGLVKAASVGLLVVLILKIIKSSIKHSPFQHIPGPKPSSSIFGYLLDIYRPDNFDFHFKMTERYGHVARLKAGIFGSDGLYISDPLALHTILVRGQSTFRESVEILGLFGVVHHGDALSSVWGNEHKKQRKLLNPVFTAAHVSRLTPLFYRISMELRDRLAAEIRSTSDNTVEILDCLTRTALEIVSQGAIGHKFNSFDKNDEEFYEFREALTNVLPPAGNLFVLLPFFESWRKFEPVWLRRSLANLAYVLPWSALRQFKKSIDTMHPVYAQIFYEKKKAFREGGITALANTASGGRDLTNLLIQANVEADGEERISDENIIANMSGFVLGGQTPASAISRLLDLMTSNPSLQTWLREEITEALAKKDGVPLDFYELNALPRLDATCREALRLFSPVAFVWKQTMQDAVVPLQFPIKDKKTGKEQPIDRPLSGETTLPNSSPKGGWAAKLMNALSSILKRLVSFSNIMTFLGGERACPGMKFALLEIKLIMSVLLSTFRFERTSDIIDWRLGISVSPYVRGKEAEGPQLPMKISML